jgi:hypothetical protein
MNLSFRRRAAAVAIAGFFSAGAFALDDSDFNYDTVSDLVAVCSASGDDTAAAALACRAFIESAMQYHDAVSDRKKMKRLTCPPATTTVGDARDVFVAWGAANAGDATLMNELPVVGLMRSLAAKYPCK